MILLYHNVVKHIRSPIEVTEDKFSRDMIALEGKSVVNLSEYNPGNSDHIVITFDDGYSRLLHFAIPLLHRLGLPFEVFLIGNKVIGGSKNHLSLSDAVEVMNYGGRIQYHSRTHPNLTETAVELLESEIALPKEFEELKQSRDGCCDFFAYPFCAYDERVRSVVARHYRGAVACREYGNDSDAYALNRDFIREDTVFAHDKTEA